MHDFQSCGGFLFFFWEFSLDVGIFVCHTKGKYSLD